MIEHKNATPDQIQALVEAAWQCLDDMGRDGTDVCLGAKALLRVAIEPFNDPASPMGLDYPLDYAFDAMRNI
jgi:hypothetical protein